MTAVTLEQGLAVDVPASLLIGGDRTRAADGAEFETYDPATGEPL
jgi:hypothetical protein